MGVKNPVWPAPRAAVSDISFLLGLAAFGAAITGLVAALLELRRGALLGPLGVGGLAVTLLGAPALAALALQVSRGSEAARRILRWTLPAAAVLAVWIADELVGARATGVERRWFGGAVCAGLVSTWGWVMLGRADVRVTFEQERRLAALSRDDCAHFACYALFVLATVGAGAATLTTPRWLAPGLAEAGYLLGSLGCGLVTTVGAFVAIGLWRGPEADLELVTPEAWARIVAQRLRPVPDIVADLERDGVPPPGRRWTLRVVIGVLRSTTRV